MFKLWSKEDSSLLFNKITSHLRFQKILQVLHFDNTNAGRTRSNKLEPIRDVSEVWNQYFQDVYIPGSCMTVEYLVEFRGAHFRYVYSKPGEYGIKIGIATFILLLKFQMKIFKLSFHYSYKLFLK